MYSTTKKVKNGNTKVNNLLLSTSTPTGAVLACMTAPIMKSLAKEYDGKIVIYKVNVDKEKELAALFNATSIPLFVFIPMNGEPQLFRGAADKATYQKAIDEFLLK